MIWGVFSNSKFSDFPMGYVASTEAELIPQNLPSALPSTTPSALPRRQITLGLLLTLGLLRLQESPLEPHK
jgi:hypothetical protein